MKNCAIGHQRLWIDAEVYPVLDAIDNVSHIYFDTRSQASPCFIDQNIIISKVSCTLEKIERFGSIIRSFYAKSLHNPHVGYFETHVTIINSFRFGARSCVITRASLDYRSFDIDLLFSITMCFTGSLLYREIMEDLSETRWVGKSRLLTEAASVLSFKCWILFFCNFDAISGVYTAFFFEEESVSKKEVFFK